MADSISGPDLWNSFWARTYARGDCWEYRRDWSDRDGYRFVPQSGGLQKRATRAHRFSYLLTRGPIPSGLVIDHLCGHPWCVRPSHLRATTIVLNAMRNWKSPAVIAQSRNCCSKGHPYTPENTYLTPGSRGRRCRECERNQGRLYRAKKGYAPAVFKKSPSFIRSEA